MNGSSTIPTPIALLNTLAKPNGIDFLRFPLQPRTLTIPCFSNSVSKIKKANSPSAAVLIVHAMSQFHLRPKPIHCLLWLTSPVNLFLLNPTPLILVLFPSQLIGLSTSSLSMSEMLAFWPPRKVLPLHSSLTYMCSAWL